MRSAHTVAQVRAAEEELLAVLPDGVLMQRAAAGLAHAVAAYLGRVYGARVLLLVGAGNNGGDALYAGAMLARRGALGRRGAAGAGQGPPGRAGGAAAGGWPAGGAPRRPLRRGPRRHRGHRRERPAARGRRGLVGSLGDVPVVAVDVPSGVEVDTGRVGGPHVHAAVTVTFGTHKVAHLVDPAARHCGAVHLVDIGLDLPAAPVEALQAEDVAALLPRPALDAHKYTRGVVGVRAGSAAYAGAAVLACAGAAGGLAGMVRYVPSGGVGVGAQQVADLVRAAHPEVVVGHGPGAGLGGRAPAAGSMAARAARRRTGGRGAARAGRGRAGRPRRPVGVPAVLTPHAGELARMLGVEREAVEQDQLAHARARPSGSTRWCC